MTIQVRVRLTYPEDLVRQPLLSRMVQDLGVEINIRRAEVGEDRGWILCEVDGQPGQVEAALRWLRQTGVQVDLLGDVLEG